MSTETHPSASENVQPTSGQGAMPGFIEAMDTGRDRRPTTYMSREHFETICNTHQLALPADAWDTLQTLPTKQPLVVSAVPRDSKGAAAQPVERLSLNNLGTALRDCYRDYPKPTWHGIDDPTLYTLNTVSAHFNQAERHDMPQPPVETEQSSESSTDSYRVTMFANQLDVRLEAHTVQDELVRMTQAMIALRYPAHLSLLPEGSYTADGVAFEKTDQGIIAQPMSIAGLQDSLQDQRILRVAALSPVTHYVLLRYGMALRAHGHLSADHAPITGAPMHESMVAQQTPELDDESFAEGYIQGGLYDYDAYGDTNPARSLSAKVRQADAAGFAYALSSLFCRYQPQGETQSRYYGSIERISAFLTNVFAQDDSFLEKTLLTQSDFAELCRINAGSTYFESLPHAEIGVSPFDNAQMLPAYFARHVEAFAAQLGQRFDSRAVYAAMRDHVSASIATDRPQWHVGHTYIHEGRTYMLREPAQSDMPPNIELQAITLDYAQTALKTIGRHLPPRETYVLWQYFKAIRQQSVVAAER